MSDSLPHPDFGSIATRMPGSRFIVRGTSYWIDAVVGYLKSGRTHDDVLHIFPGIDPLDLLAIDRIRLGEKLRS